MKRVSQPRSRRAVTCFRSGPTSAPCPMVWQVEQAFRNSALPWLLLEPQASPPWRNRSAACVPPSASTGSSSLHIRDDRLKVGEQRRARPVAGFLVAQHQIVAMLGQLAAAFAELEADVLHVLRLAGEEQPAVAGLESVGVDLEHLRRIVHRVHGDRVDEHVAPDRLAEPPLHLRQPRRGQRADVVAGEIAKLMTTSLSLMRSS